jgi:TolA-binding protein
LRWQRDYLAARLQRVEGHFDDALRNASSLLLTEDRTNRAEGVDFQAGVLEQMGNIEGAAAAYTNNLVPEAPPAQQRRAILKIAELDMKQPGKLPDAVQSLTNYLERTPPPEASDLALLTLGEVRLKQALNGETNLFQNAFAQFEHLVNSYTNSPLMGKAWLDEGWCLWSEKKITESQEAFRKAVEHLPFSEDQAEARFKWADTQFELRDYVDAVTNYNFVAEKYQSLQQAREEHLIERALYQAARAALNEPKPDTVAATSALKNILQWYPNGLFGPAALLLTGQGLTEEKNPGAARELFTKFEQLYPDNELLPEVRLAVARSYEAEGNWEAAITNYTAWTAAFPRHPLLPQATFNLALDHYLAGRETNALALFTNFIARFPTNLLAARAQYWAGDFYFRQGDWLAAEKNYQLVFQNTNWLKSDLIYDARMMAGKSAMARFDYRQARSYFSTLFSLDCPKPLQVQATMAYADATISQDSTNKIADLNDAIQSLQTILQPAAQADTPEAALARGRIGDCYFALGATDPDQYTNAALYYRKVFESPGANSAARNEARFKLGATIEKQAALKTGAEQTALLKQALDQFVDVFYQGLNDPERPSPLWTKKSGMEAAQLAEALQKWPVAIKIYQQLKDLLPVLAPSCDRKIAKAREHLM